jgi:uncharacterized protein RhaS with RHS repeats
MYLSQDPIGLWGGSAFYSYVYDPNSCVDGLGLSCTKELKKNMNKANQELERTKGYQNRAWHKEKGSAAHHIVAGDDMRAKPARNILRKHNIDLNSAENGIYLKHMDSNSKQPGAYHRVIHTDKYYADVNSRIKAADIKGGKPAVEAELSKIQNELLFNTKIY